MYALCALALIMQVFLGGGLVLCVGTVNMQVCLFLDCVIATVNTQRFVCFGFFFLEVPCIIKLSFINFNKFTFYFAALLRCSVVARVFKNKHGHERERERWEEGRDWEKIRK